MACGGRGGRNEHPGCSNPISVPGGPVASPLSLSAGPTMAVAVGGNVLGCLLTFGMGWAGRQGYERFQGVRTRVDMESQRVQNLRRRGPPALILSFLPLVGDALVLAAGWLNMPFWQSMAWIALGKAARYTVLLLSIKGLMALS